VPRVCARDSEKDRERERERGTFILGCVERVGGFPLPRVYYESPVHTRARSRHAFFTVQLSLLTIYIPDTDRLRMGER
jgi:hypothetical protein